METKYSKTQFDGFTHRFKVQFEIGKPYYSNLDIYSNSGSYQKLEDFINEKKSAIVISFKIIQCSSKEQDEIESKFIDETLRGL